MLRLLTLSAILFAPVSGQVPTSAEEARAEFFGDLDPKARAVQGQITIRPGYNADQLQGWRLYATSTGTDHLTENFADGSGAGGTDAQFVLDLDISCPVSSSNTDWDSSQYSTYAQLACENNNPYSPKCSGDCTESTTTGNTNQEGSGSETTTFTRK